LCIALLSESFPIYRPVLHTDILKLINLRLIVYSYTITLLQSFVYCYVYAFNKSVTELLCVWALPCDITNKNI